MTPALVASDGRSHGLLRVRLDERVNRYRLASLLAAVFTLLGATFVSAQRDTDILSKLDAAQMFGLTKQQWQDNLVAVVKAGIGTRSGDALTLKTPAGTVTTLPVYIGSDARPSRLEVVVLMPNGYVVEDATVSRLMRDTRRQMEPEYLAEGRSERLQDGKIQFYFTVSEKSR